MLRGRPVERPVYVDRRDRLVLEVALALDTVVRRGVSSFHHAHDRRRDVHLQPVDDHVRDAQHYSEQEPHDLRLFVETNRQKINRLLSATLQILIAKQTDRRRLWADAKILVEIRSLGISGPTAKSITRRKSMTKNCRIQ